MSAGVLYKENNLTHFDKRHYDAGRYSHGDEVIADPNGLGRPSIFMFNENRLKTECNLGSYWDPDQSPEDQGTGTSTGAFDRVRQSIGSIRDFGYDGQVDWTSAFNRAIKDALKTGSQVFIDPVFGEENWYKVNDLDVIPNLSLIHI